MLVLFEQIIKLDLDTIIRKFTGKFVTEDISFPHLTIPEPYSRNETSQGPE